MKKKTVTLRIATSEQSEKTKCPKCGGNGEYYEIDGAPSTVEVCDYCYGRGFVSWVDKEIEVIIDEGCDAQS